MVDKNRLEKVMWGSLWATRRTYISNGKLLGTITKNPYTEKYEALKSDFKKRAYIPKEFEKLSNAKSFIKKR